MSAGKEALDPGIARDDVSPFPRAAPSDPDAPLVHSATIQVDASADHGDLRRIWRSIGYDEINWTYTPTGRRLLRTFGGMEGQRRSERGAAGDSKGSSPLHDRDAAYHVRPHYVYCSGSGFAIPHWGNGNVYHEDDQGRPYYDFTIVDQTYDAIVEAGHHVLVELGFTPRDLVPDEAAELTVVSSPTAYSSYEAGTWAYPPRDYEKWRGLIIAHVEHCLERYGDAEVSQWLWELWNEPDIFYWRGTPEQFFELYAVTAEAIKSVSPDLLVGGPAVTGGGVTFLRDFLAYCAEHSLPLDFVSFHTKGSAFTPWRAYGPTGGPAPERQNPSAPKMLYEIRRLLRVMAEFDQYRELPAIIDECDAGVPAHHSVYDNANFGFQNTEYYPVFQAKLFKKLLDLNDQEGSNVQQATSWSFYFEGERFFEGTRAFLTAGGIEKPLLNAYRMLGRLGRRRIEATSTASWPVGDLDGLGGRSMPEEIDTLASADEDGTVAVLVWRHTDDQYREDAEPARVDVSVAGLSARSYTIEHYRIDHDHSNAHTVWRGLGSPQDPSEAELAAIKQRQGLERFAPDRRVTTGDEKIGLELTLPLPSVSLVILTPEPEDR